MEFSSDELKNARASSASSIHEDKSPPINTEDLKNNLKLFLLLKDKSLLKSYDLASFSRNISNSGNETMKSFLYLLKDFYTLKYKEDNTKNLSIRKNLDIIFLAIDNLIINNTDITSDEFNALFIGFLNKNFL